MPDRDPAPVARLLRIRGRVQGVWYRASAVEQAQRLGLRGWVRNRADGSVEILVAGSESGIEDFLDWARIGPPKAQVSRIEIEAADPAEAGPFAQRPDH
ncbi:MAG: acylphosphatase [Thauera phenolivorans]|uniref:acylphosphatase n=1 Tax=Thauera phenolivorans TaxID=1792543 RepID=A0A7X7LVK9_9RHOO|nr:acylphosphatase [Thauera phenolivorans]NLF54033.1 acylphosphatase [Thauera phenolivorans]